jgi:hypothetical protein
VVGAPERTQRAALVSYANALDTEEARAAQIRDVVFDRVPTFAREVPFLRQAFTGKMTVTAADMTNLIGNEEAAALMFTLLAANVNRVNGFERIRDHTMRVRAMLEAEVGPPK